LAGAGLRPIAPQWFGAFEARGFDSRLGVTVGRVEWWNG
jgi:hypothetical protein